MGKDKKNKLRRDANENAYRVFREATGQAKKTKPPGERTDEEKNPEAVERGSQGGEKGGPARARSLTAEEREEIARRAATDRWSNGD